MNRSKAFFSAALAAAVMVACNVDRMAPSQNGYTQAPPITENVLTPVYDFFKYKDKNGTWHCLDLVGDSLRYLNATPGQAQYA